MMISQETEQRDRVQKLSHMPEDMGQTQRSPQCDSEQPYTIAIHLRQITQSIVQMCVANCISF